MVIIPGVQLSQPVCWLYCRKSVGFVGRCLLALLPKVWVLSESGRKNERKFLRLILCLIAGIVYPDQTQEEQICENHGRWNIKNQSPTLF